MDTEIYSLEQIYVVKQVLAFQKVGDHLAKAKVVLKLCVCGTVSSMLSGLETRSLGHTLGTT